ncbi:MAG TPA: pur operon repressor [Clostridiales bacterium]|nr:pur operon repressor [Clostridiales bacterium]
MKRTDRICRILQILMENPNRVFPLGYFAALFDCAKSSVSQDMKTIRESVAEGGYGRVTIATGARGGVRYMPHISGEKAQETLREIQRKFLETDRVLGSGFLYTSDIMFDPGIARGAAGIFARRFAESEATCVVTVETKGIAIAAFTAELLHLPLIVLRRESKISEGSTVSINYFSGSADRIQKMSLAKRALQPGAKALIIDDFMRGGGSIKGIQDMLGEFDAHTVGIGVMIVAESDHRKKIGDYFPLLLLDLDEKGEGVAGVRLNPEIENNGLQVESQPEK